MSKGIAKLILKYPRHQRTKRGIKKAAVIYDGVWGGGENAWMDISVINLECLGRVPKKVV